MKTTTRILSIIAILALLAGCAPALTAQPTATTTPPPTSTSRPLPTFTNTPEPEPTPTAKIEVPLEMQSVTIEAAKNFANALTDAGMPITFEEVLNQGLVIEQHEENGNKFEIATSQGFPLMMKMEGGEWEEAKIKNSCEAATLICGAVSGIGVTRDWISDHENVKKIMADGTALKIDYDFMWWLPEKEQQADSLRPTQSTFNFKNLDDAAKFAKQNNLDFTGQTLLVQNPYFLPQWLIDISNSGNKEQLMEVAQKHITNLVTRYPDATDWTVLAELQNPYFTNPWVKSFGLTDVTWIADMYKTAKEANPNAKLIYCDFDIEFGGNKADEVFALMQKAIAAGAPIDAIAFQMHINAIDILNDPQKLEELGRQIDRYKNIGIDVELGEMDMSMINTSSNTNERAALQAEAIDDVMKMAIKHGVKKIYLFGINDFHSWKNQEQNGGGPEADATLFNDQSEPKLSYYTFLRAIFAAQ